MRTCARPGCGGTTKKPTARYCSVACSASDPVRIDKIRDAVLAYNRGARPPDAPRRVRVVDEPELPDREGLPAGFARLRG